MAPRFSDMLHCPAHTSLSKAAARQLPLACDLHTASTYQWRFCTAFAAPACHEPKLIFLKSRQRAVLVSILLACTAMHTCTLTWFWTYKLVPKIALICRAGSDVCNTIMPDAYLGGHAEALLLSVKAHHREAAGFSSRDSNKGTMLLHLQCQSSISID